MFQPAGECIVTEDLWAERWTKLTINCMANPTASMTGLTNYSMRTDDDTRRLMLKFGVEAMRVGRALGHDVKSPVANFDLEDIERASNGPHPEFEAVFIGKPPEFSQQVRDDYTANRYHQPSDEFDPTWDFSGAALDFEALFRVALAISAADTWPEWREGNEFKATRDAMLGR